MGSSTDGAPARRLRPPVAPVIAVLVGAVAILGYSIYRLPSAYDAYRRCIPLPRSGHCPYVSFWGFSPMFYFLAAIIGIVAGVMLAVLAWVLWVWPRRHETLGVIVLSVSFVSMLAYGGEIVGLAAGIIGGVLAILYRPPRSRAMARWVGPHANGRTSTGSETSGGRGATTAPPDEAPPSLSADAYAPLPPVWRPYSVATPVRASPAPSARPRFATLAEALAGQAPAAPSLGTGPAVPAQPPPPHPTAPAPLASARRPPATAPPASSGTPPPPPTQTRALTTSPAGTSTLGVAGPLPVPASTPSRGQAWKCARCELTNAPWSKTCTRCQSMAPPV